MGMSDEEVLGGGLVQGLSDEEVMGMPAPKKEIRGQVFSDDQLMAHADASYGGAIATALTGGFRQGVAGLMEAGGDILAPEDTSFGQAFAESQKNGPSVLGAITSVANTVRKKLTRAEFPEGGVVQQFGKDLQGAGAEAGDEARVDIEAATPEGTGFWGQAGISAAQSVGQMTPWVIGARAGLRPTFVTPAVLTQFGANSFGQTYNEAKANGASPEDALAAAALSGGAEAAGEMLGLQTLLKQGSGWFKKFLMREIGGEEFTTIVQSLTEKAKYNPEKWDSPDEIVHDLALTAVSTAMGAGTIGGVNKAADTILQNRREQAFDNSEAQRELDNIFTAAALEVPDTGPAVAPIYQPTPEEEVQAKIVKEQMLQGLDVEPTAEGMAFGAAIDRIIGSNQAEGRTVAGDPEANLDEGGVTDYVLAGRERRYQPNVLPASQRPIRFSTDESVLGLTLAQTGELPAGAVVAIGGTEDVFPTEVYSKLTTDLGTWAKRYMPEARIVLNLEQFAPEHQATAFGLHQMDITKGGLLHVITPRDLPSFKYQGGDQKTQMAMLAAVAHEFGHALKAQTLVQEVGKAAGWDVAQAFHEESKLGGFSPEVMGALQARAPLVAAMVQDWQDLRGKVLAGELTAKEFVESWAGLRKLGGDNLKTVARNKSLYNWAVERLGQAGKTLEGSTAQELILAPFEDTESPEAQAFLQDYLSLDEYMAEQFSRASWTEGDIERSAVGQLFYNGLQKLKQLFRDLKGEKIIAPGTTFQAWLDSQTLRARSVAPKVEGKFKLSKEVKAARKAFLKKQSLLDQLVREEESAAATPPEQVEVPKDVQATQVLTKERLLEVAIDLENQGAFYGARMGSDAFMRGLKGMIERGQLEQAREKIEGAVQDVIHWDREYSSKVLERLPNKEKIKAETLRSTLKMQDIKEGERVAWEKFLEEHPEGFSKEEAEEAVASNVMILEQKHYGEYASYGMAAVGLDPSSLYTSASSVVWQAPIPVPSTNHFKDPQYVMHSRRLDAGKSRYVVELQSDLFQHLDEGKLSQRSNKDMEEIEEELYEVKSRLDQLGDFSKDIQNNPGVPLPELFQKEDFAYAFGYPSRHPQLQEAWDNAQQIGRVRLGQMFAQQKQRWQLKVTELENAKRRLEEGTHTTEAKLLAMKKNWWERLIREEVTDAFESGKVRVLFPSADTLAKIEGWQKLILLPQLEGSTYIDIDNISWTMTGRVELYSSLDTAGVEVEGTTGGTEMLYVKESDNEQTRRLMETAKKGTSFTYGEMQGIYDRYKREVAKFLKREYKAEEVEEKGHTWLQVDPSVQGSKVLNWDRDNPLQPQHPEIVLEDFAGLTQEDLRKPEVIAEASAMYERLGTESPYFKRWFGESKVRTVDGKPRSVWRGAGNAVTYLDPAARGTNSGSLSARKAFWFTENRNLAQWYADKSRAKAGRVPAEENMRKISAEEVKLADLRELAQEMGENHPHRKLVQARILKKMDELTVLRSQGSRPAQPVVQEFFLKMENPLVVDAAGRGYDDKIWTEWVNEALAAGHDGVVVENGLDPLPGKTYAIFEPVQAKARANVGTFDKTDELHWDRDSAESIGVRNTAKLMQNFWGRMPLRGMNMVSWMVDNIIQLQQVAASQPDDVALQSFVRLNTLAMKMKNNLQVDAEEVVKKMRHAAPKTVNKLRDILRAEHKGNVLQATVVGVNEYGAVVWGGDQPTTPETKALVRKWQVQDGLRLRAFLESQGIDFAGERGQEMVDLYLGVRNAMLVQFTGLENALKHKAVSMYENAPTVLKRELWKIDEMMTKFRDQPFLPHGNFGNYVLVTLKDQGKQGRGKRRFQPIRKEHFESKADWQKAYEELKATTASDPTLQVRQLEIEENAGIPMQLPNDFIEALGNTGMFTDEQLDLMAEAMIKSKYERIEKRFEKISEHVEGSNEDFMRVFADFSLRNSNFIWKMFFRTSFRSTLGITRKAMRDLDKRKDMDPVLQRKEMDRQRRNLAIMGKALDHMLYPAQEYQRAKLMVTMGFLAYNIKTAVLNAGTQMHTWAAVTSEYGELRGNKIWLQSIKDAVSLHWISKLKETAQGDELRRLNEIDSVYQKAIEDGVLDQSYAYYLAGQANSSIGLRALHNSYAGRAGHLAMEAGMLPFKAVEKANRVVSLLTFYQAERSMGTNPAASYEIAVQKTNLLQGDYGAANKPVLLRGKKSIFFMFASYGQMMGWITSGGYERGARKQMQAMGRDLPGRWHGTTAKLWLLYLMLGGIGGLPYAKNVLDLATFVWRKLFGRTENIELELKKLVGDVTGDANLAMHGLMFRAGGFDLSGSFGLGRLLPGTDVLNKDWKKPEDLLGGSLLKFAGPAGGFYSAVAKAMLEFADGEWKEGFKQLPGEAGALAKSYDAMLAQERKPTYGVTTKQGTRLTYDEATGKFRDLTTGELLGMALGAQTTLVSENRELHYTTQGEIIYWQTRRGDLLDKYWKAVRTGDEEMRGEVLAGIADFNQHLPDRKLHISGKDRADTVASRKKAMRLAEKYGTPYKSTRGIAGDVREDLEATVRR